jgi:hypothetical protein
LKSRPRRLEDAEQAGKTIFLAFAAIAEKHGFPPTSRLYMLEETSPLLSYLNLAFTR